MIKFRKDHISIKQIGLLRFWMGIALGLFTATVISMFFTHFDELFRFLGGARYDLYIPAPEITMFYDRFYSILAVSLGFSITMWIWLKARFGEDRKTLRRKRIAQTYILVIFWTVLLVFVRFSSILGVLLGPMLDTETINLHTEYALLFYLLPPVIFLQCWFEVRRIFLCGKWIFSSLLLCLIVAGTLSITTNVDQQIFNEQNEKRNQHEYDFMNREIARADSLYSIRFDEETVINFRNWYSPKTMEQIYFVQKAFGRDHNVSLDTIIMEKIIVHNIKSAGYKSRANWTWHTWDYAYPRYLFKQIHLADKNSAEMTELFMLLNEEILLCNGPDTTGLSSDKLSNYEQRGVSYAFYNIPPVAIDRLIEVRDTLLSDTNFRSYHHFLIPIEPKSEDYLMIIRTPD